MKYEELKMLQALSLDIKILKSKQRIREWIDYYGENGVYVSFSGGKDSTALHHLVLDIELELFGEMRIPRVFSDTGLEFPELREFVHNLKKEYRELIVIVRPKKAFPQIIKEIGYPAISKINARKISDLQNPRPTNKTSRVLYETGYNSKGKKSPLKLAKKWLYLKDVDFKLSHKCCDLMKKEPFRRYEKETHRKPFIGVMATESRDRLKSYLKNGCNAFNASKIQSRPIGFWRETDVLEYLKVNNFEIAPVYGEIIQKDDDTYTTTGEKRTGCMYCMFGCDGEMKRDGETRFQRMKRTHPKQWEYCIRGGKYEKMEQWYEIKSINSDKVMYYKGYKMRWIPNKGLGLKHVLETIGIPYK